MNWFRRTQPRVPTNPPRRKRLQALLDEMNPWYRRWPDAVSRAIRSYWCRRWGHKQPYQQRISCLTCRRCGQVVQSQSRSIPLSLATKLSPPTRKPGSDDQ